MKSLPALLDLAAGEYGAVNHTDRAAPPPPNSKQPKLPPNDLPAHPFHHGHPGLRDEVAVSGVWERRDERTIRNELGREFACSGNIDIQIGRVLAKLEAIGELANTCVINTADHGMAIGRHGLQGKQNLYQHTWRVPFIVAERGSRPDRPRLRLATSHLTVEAPSPNTGVDQHGRDESPGPGIAVGKSLWEHRIIGFASTAPGPLGKHGVVFIGGQAGTYTIYLDNLPQ